MIAQFDSVKADPYVWPFDGNWSSNDTALILAGFQNGAIDRLNAQTELAVAAKLIETARTVSLPLIFTRRGSRVPGNAVSMRRAMMGDIVEAHGTDGWRLSSVLQPREDDRILDHGGDNAFFGTDLETDLRSSGIRNLVLAGLPTEGLLHATQRAANDMGFECIAVSDACKATSKERHEAQLRITTFGNGLFGAVAPSDAIHIALNRRKIF